MKKHTTASFDVDPQYSFTPHCPDELPVPDGHTIVDELNAQAQFANKRLLSKEAHSPEAVWVATHENPIYTPLEGEHVDAYWPSHSVPGTKGFTILEGLPALTDYHYVVYKGVELDMHPYGSCYHDAAEQLSTGAIEFLRQHSIENVIVGGLATDYCVKVTAIQLAKAGFGVVLNLAACRGIAEETVQSALAEMQSHQIQVVESVTALEALYDH